MKAPSRTYLRPDALTGAVLAFEGLQGAVSIINAPTGCKFGTGFLVDAQDPGGATLDPMEYESEFFFGQARVPSTALDEMDYVHGSKAKLSRLLKILESKGSRLIGVVNGPGTSLIGDNLAGIAQDAGVSIPVVPIESSGFTGTLPDGFQEATMALLKRLNPKPQAPHRASVNLIGLTLEHAYWKHDQRELRRLMAVAGVKVNVVLSAGTPLEDLEQISAASLNAVVHEEYGHRTAAFLKEKYGTPVLEGPRLSPYGLLATERWVEDIAERLGNSPEEFREESRNTRKLLHQTLSRLAAVTGLPRGATFAIFGDSSIVAPILLFLSDHLGMIPTLTSLHEVSDTNLDFLKAFLAKKGLNCPLLIRPDTFQIREFLQKERPDVILGSHGELALAQSLWSNPPGFVGISSPLWGSPRLTFRPRVGLTGALSLVEDLLPALEGLVPGALVR